MAKGSNMGKIHSHYDNLKVSRDAPEAVIRAAYRTLSQQYHPDLAKSPDAARIMAIINVSYAILSDPVKRTEHDNWLAMHEIARTAHQDSSRENCAEKPKHTPPPLRQPNQLWARTRKILHTLPFQAWLVIGVLAYLTLADKSDKPTQTKPYVPVTIQAIQRGAVTSQSTLPFSYEKPLLAPTGEPWPRSAGYLKSYNIGRSGGLSTVTVDNTNNQYDVYVKLVYTDEALDKAVRHVYLPKGQSFTMRDVAQGEYEIRYKNLDTGGTFKADYPFRLKEVENSEGIQYSNIRMTLYTVQNGNMRTRSIPEDQF
jgi:hypothetical protein